MAAKLLCPHSQFSRNLPRGCDPLLKFPTAVLQLLQCLLNCIQVLISHHECDLCSSIRDILPRNLVESRCLCPILFFLSVPTDSFLLVLCSLGRSWQPLPVLQQREECPHECRAPCAACVTVNCSWVDRRMCGSCVMVTGACYDVCSAGQGTREDKSGKRKRERVIV